MNLKENQSSTLEKLPYPSFEPFPVLLNNLLPNQFVYTQTENAPGKQCPTLDHVQNTKEFSLQFHCYQVNFQVNILSSRQDILYGCFFYYARDKQHHICHRPHEVLIKMARYPSPYSQLPARVLAPHQKLQKIYAQFPLYTLAA